jgi:hypothetical protein
MCGGTGKVPLYERVSNVVTSPKDKIFIEELDAHEDDGRYIVWGAFTGTIDRLVTMAHQQGWATLRVDGRGYHGMSALGEQIDDEELLDALDSSHPLYEDYRIKYPKICFVGQPQSGGMALTLTASRTSLFYSNSYDGTARPQAEKRAHRAGMKNRAHTLKDLFCLPTDRLVYENLMNKLKMQDQTLGRVEEISIEEIRRVLDAV